MYKNVNKKFLNQKFPQAPNFSAFKSNITSVKKNDKCNLQKNIIHGLNKATTLEIW